MIVLLKQERGRGREGTPPLMLCRRCLVELRCAAIRSPRGALANFFATIRMASQVLMSSRDICFFASATNPAAGVNVLATRVLVLLAFLAMIISV